MSPLKPGKPLKRCTPLNATALTVNVTIDSRKAKRQPISQASTAQRSKATVCLVTKCRKDEGWTVDPAHLASRAHGGCDDPLCVVPLRRDLHEAFDRGELDLLPHLLAHGMVAEIQHALGHYRGDLLGLAARLCGERAFVPERQERVA